MAGKNGDVEMTGPGYNNNNGGYSMNDKRDYDCRGVSRPAIC